MFLTVFSDSYCTQVEEYRNFTVAIMKTPQIVALVTQLPNEGRFYGRPGPAGEGNHTIAVFADDLEPMPPPQTNLTFIIYVPLVSFVERTHSKH
jgi:hypothetical protein